MSLIISRPISLHSARAARSSVCVLCIVRSVLYGFATVLRYTRCNMIASPYENATGNKSQVTPTRVTVWRVESTGRRLADIVRMYPCRDHSSQEALCTQPIARKSITSVHTVRHAMRT